MQTFKDKVILITGANRGIGKSLVKSSLEKGARKIYATSRDLSKMPNFGDERVVTLELNITDNTQILKIAEQTKDVEVLINNAGILSQGNILEGEISAVENDMNVNYYGTINMMRAFAPILEKNAPAKIVNMVSIAAYSSLPFSAGYSASKSALFSATQSVRIELVKKNILVQAINLGAVPTDMTKGMPFDMPSSDSVAKLILDKVETGELDIVPDEIGLGMFNDWKEAPSKLAKMYSDKYHGE
jgi:NAD(P)-dependent dehydrogenase (short-subunit alcohol dehydrogenase family)